MVLSILSPSFWVVFAYNIERKYSKKDYASKNRKMVVTFSGSYGYLLKKDVIISFLLGGGYYHISVQLPFFLF